MKVRCIRNEHHEHNLTIGKVYDVQDEGHESYYVINDKGNVQEQKSYRFEIIEGDKMEVRCIDNESLLSCLTIDKVYNAETKGDDYYSLIDDRNRDAIYKKSRFEIVEDNDPVLGLDVLDITQNGIKHDTNKLKPTLLIDDMPLAIQEVLKVLKFGAEKYSEGNWLKVDNGINRYRNAADRHRLQSPINDIDDESGLLHLAHEATSILMLLELKLRGKQ